MPTKMSIEVVREVKKILPALRAEIKKEFSGWSRYNDGNEFHSDEKVVETLPYAAYEYIILCWGIDPSRISIPAVVEALNKKMLKDLRAVTAHALRRLASLEMNSRK